MSRKVRAFREWDRWWSRGLIWAEWNIRFFGWGMCMQTYPPDGYRTYSETEFEILLPFVKLGISLRSEGYETP